MNKLLSITNKAAEQIKKIVSNAPNGVDSVLVGIENSGCSGYSYKLDFAKSSEVNNFECIDKNGVKIFVDPKATMFLLGSTMDYRTDKLSSRFVFDARASAEHGPFSSRAEYTPAWSPIYATNKLPAAETFSKTLPVNSINFSSSRSLFAIILLLRKL